MVFIVKIPNRHTPGSTTAAGNDAAQHQTSDPEPQSSSTQSSSTSPPAAQGGSEVPRRPGATSQGNTSPSAPPPPASSQDEALASLEARAASLSLGTRHAHDHLGSSSSDASPSLATPKSTDPAHPPPAFSSSGEGRSSSTSTSISTALDVILAPGVLSHRFVRSRDTSLIVERPERIRAVCLGIAALLGRIQAGDAVVADQRNSTGPMALLADHRAHADNLADTSLDALTSSLQGLSVDAPDTRSSTSTADGIHVLLSTRGLALSSSTSAALSMVHAHEDERLEAEYTAVPKYAQAQARRERRRRRQHPAPDQVDKQAQPIDSAPTSASSYGELPYVDYLARLCSVAPGQPPAPKPKPVRTPRGAGKRSNAPSPLKTAAAPASVAPRTEAPPGGQASPPTSPPVVPAALPPANTPKRDLGAATGQAVDGIRDEQGGGSAVDEEDDDDDDKEAAQGADHASEVPDYLPQGDLYLCGPHRAVYARDGDVHTEREPGPSGSAMAISHALGAACLAVDRVVAAAKSRQNASWPSGEDEGKANADVCTLLPRATGAAGSENATPSSSLSSMSSTPSAPSRRSFVLTRPPGHHCSATSPQGFCWVNNAIVAAAHAHHVHAIDRVVLLDIDLHHGNGTQSLAWRINAETAMRDATRQAEIDAKVAAALEADAAAQRQSAPRGQRARRSAGGGGGGGGGAGVGAAETDAELDERERRRRQTVEEQVEAGMASRRGLKVFYASLHDIESFPCEDGDAERVRDASTVIEGAHGQWIVNVHLETAETREEFERLYRTKYLGVLDAARRFVRATSARAEGTLVVLSTGFDASSLEYSSMQRHGKSVPPRFYRDFARDAAALADEVAEGKLVSLLEGGYSDRALCSGALAHLGGLAGVSAAAERRGPPTAAAMMGAAATPEPATLGKVKLEETEAVAGPTSSSHLGRDLKERREEARFQAKGDDRRQQDQDDDEAVESWWSAESLAALEAMAKRVAKEANVITKATTTATPATTTTTHHAAAHSGIGASTTGTRRRGPDPYKGQAWLAAASESFAALQAACGGSGAWVN